MKPILPMSIAQQVAGHIRSHVVEQRMKGDMPGIHQLADELMVNHKTVKAAFDILQKEGLLVSQGRGKPRRIRSEGLVKARVLRIAILLFEPEDRANELILGTVHRLVEAGHQPFYAKKTLMELRMSVNRVSSLVSRTEADAWVIAAGSQPIIEWFSKRPVPAFALYGRLGGASIASAGPIHLPALQEAVDHLISLGHQRIVMLAREQRRKPKPGASEQLFLERLAAAGILTGKYNLPDWVETADGLRALLDALFRNTPPTALVIQGQEFTMAVLLYCANHGIKVPQQLSVISMDPDKDFVWCEPAVSHIHHDSKPLMKRMVAWANNIARGCDDRQMITTTAEFIQGGTTAPPFKKR